jgi:alkylation response protein AidB-like acyl-CoA dehydrogenase
VTAHPRLRGLLAQLRDLGVITASRPTDVGGQQLPLTVAAAANLYLMAGNLSAFAYLGLTAGAGHLIETFGSPALRSAFLEPLYAGRWMGTMALTEPQAGSSVGDALSRAQPSGDHFLVSGSKIFISGGDHDLAENIVHLTLARIDGAPPGPKGLSLFAIPKLRPAAAGLEPNDVRVTGVIHKIGWRGLPSLALAFGEGGDCHGWLVGEPHRGLAYMFQMMNEARIMVGANGVATAAVAFQESLAYARERTQGRSLTQRSPTAPQIPIIEHADVRRMLLRQKAIVEGGTALVLATALWSDRAEHAATAEERAHAHLLLDMLTPVAKSFPSEWGFESNALALQIHGGYGYSSEYPVEAWLRDQKLNTLHEGTTGIQGLDLLGRKVVAGGGTALQALQSELGLTAARARAAGVPEAWTAHFETVALQVAEVTMEMAGRGLGGDVEGMMRHSADYLDLFSILVVAWQWLGQAAAAHEGLHAQKGPESFYRGKLQAAQYWLCEELPLVTTLVARCRDNDDAYARMEPDWF